jgi:hypothetical protein
MECVDDSPRQALSDEDLTAQFRLDTAENEPYRLENGGPSQGPFCPS